MRISDWISDVCSSDLRDHQRRRRVLPFDAGAGVVLHVAHPAELDAAAPGEQRVLELGQDLRVRLLHHVSEHVQPATMGHRDEIGRAWCRERGGWSVWMSVVHVFFKKKT